MIAAIVVRLRWRSYSPRHSSIDVASCRPRSVDILKAIAQKVRKPVGVKWAVGMTKTWRKHYQAAYGDYAQTRTEV
jgi:hypothetical protein